MNVTGESAGPEAIAAACGFDPTMPNAARVYDYLLGGKTHFAADREVADRVLASVPAGRTAARENRAFLGRAVRYLAAEQGVRQYLDIGTGLPAAGNVHEAAQRTAPESRVVYVDRDPMVIAHARALLTSSPEGRTDYVDADMHDPELILSTAAQTLDFSQPVALLFIGVLGHVTDQPEAQQIVRTLLDGLPPRSSLVLADGTNRRAGAAATEEQYAKTGAARYHLRSPEEISAFFGGLDLIEPGVVPLTQWRPDTTGAPVHIDSIGGVARKPGQ